MQPRVLFKLYGINLIVFYVFLNERVACAVKESAASSEERIIRDVIGKFSTNVRPVVDSKDTVNVTLDITFNNIIDLNEKFQILKSSIWVRQMWTNPFFKWNESHYGGLKSILVDSRKIWLPDFALYNNIHEEEAKAHLDQRFTRVRIYNSGLAFWASPFIFKTLCKINVQNFPFDTQKCKLIFGAWQYDGNEVNIQNDKKFASFSATRIASGEWDVLKVEIKRTVIYYKCCPNQPYPELSFVIHMKRKPMFFVVNLIIPNILIALLAFFSFFIPVECGERISFVITVLLSMTVFMLLIAESIPPTSDAVPLIGIYYTFSIIEVFLALTATAVSLKINYSYLFGGGLSPRLKHVIFKYIGPWLGFNIPNLLGVKSKEKNVNPSSISYRSNCCTGQQRGSTMSPTDEMEQKTHTDASLSVGRARNFDHRPCNHHQYNYLEMSNKTSNNGQAESLVMHDGMNDMDVRLCYRKRNDHMNDDLDGVLPMRRSEEEQRIIESKLAASIVDRLFLWIFTVMYVISSAVILSIPMFRP